MAEGTTPARLVIVAYDPKNKTKSRISRSEALSHAASVAYYRRQQKKPATQTSKSQAVTKTRKHQCSGQCDPRLCPIHPYPDPSFRGSILGRGNSDAFDCVAIPVTAEVNDLIGFWRYHIFRTAQHQNRQLLQTLLKNDLLNMHDVAGGDAFLLSASIIKRLYAGGSTDLTTEELQRKHKAISRLREDIDGGFADSTVLFRTIGCLYAASMFTHQFEEANIHKNQYIRIMQNVHHGQLGAGSPVIFPLFLRFLVFGPNDAIDQYPSNNTETHFIQFISAILTPFVEWAETTSASTSTVMTEMGRANESLLTCMRRIIDRQRGRADSFNQLCTLKQFFDKIGDGMNCFRTTTRPHQNGVHPPTAIDAVLFCTVFVIASTAVFSTADGQPQDSINDRLRADSGMREHKQCIQNAMMASGHSEVDKRALLWALYVGTSWEIRFQLEGATWYDWASWYQPELVKLVAEMHIIDWDSFLLIIEQFVRVESILHPGAKLENIMFIGFDVWMASDALSETTVTDILANLLFPHSSPTPASVTRPRTKIKSVRAIIPKEPKKTRT